VAPAETTAQNTCRANDIELHRHLEVMKHLTPILLSTLVCACHAYAQLENPRASEMLTDSRGMTAHIRVNAFYYAGQTVKNSNQVVDRSGFFTTADYPEDKRLFDKSRTMEGSVATHFWSNQAKRVEIDIEG
jgi:hypothetical protein